MRALVKEGSRLQLQELPVPLPAADEVLIRVRAAGLCRTDALVMAGQLPAANPLIPGHELAGEVAGYGPATRGWRLGEPVTVHPQIGCGTCGACAGRRPEHCRNVRMLGVDLHGAFAEYVCVPAHAVWHLPAELDWRQGAYAEPLAAMLGVFRVLEPGQRGTVLGDNRIAEMTRRLLSWKGFCLSEAGELDFLIESGLDSAALAAALERLRPGGQLIAKSRHLAALELPWSQLVRKDLRIQGLYYGDFAEAVALLAQPPAVRAGLFAGLIGPSFDLAHWPDFIAPGPESAKRFVVFG